MYSEAPGSCTASQKLYICKNISQLKTPFRICIALLVSVFVLSSCQTIDLYEKTVTIPGHQWKSSFQPSFSFTIKDTSVPYKVYVTLRHFDKYNYNNIYLRISTRQPGDDSARAAMYPFDLGNDEQGWKASGMDDIYEHRLPVTPEGQSFYFRRKGEYTLTLEQAMREDPLENVLNVGIRIEKQ